MNSKEVAILQYIKKYSGATPHEIAEEFNLSRSMVHRYLKRMLRYGDIKKDGSAPKTTYHVRNENFLRKKGLAEEGECQKEDVTSLFQKAVAKFGGTSVVKYPNIIQKVFECDNKKRKFFVVSAPGAKEQGSIKLTDILINLSNQKKVTKKDYRCILEKIDEIGIEYNQEKIRCIIQEAFNKKNFLKEVQYKALIISLGEKISAMVYADFLGGTFLDAADLLVVRAKDGKYDDAQLDFIQTQKQIEKQIKRFEGEEKFIVPGFYGRTKSGKVATFSRGGSDLTGAYLAYFFNQDIYENYTDFPILSADPRIVHDPKQIREVTYQEMRDLTYSGFSILHQDVVAPLFEKKIEIEVKSTAKFNQQGTYVREKRIVREEVLAVSGKEDFVYVGIKKQGLSDMDHAIVNIISVFKDADIQIEHISTGIDEVSLVIEKKDKQKLPRVCSEVSKVFGLEKEMMIDVGNISILCVSGIGMKNRLGMLSEITKVLAENKINIVSVDQSMNQSNILFFVIPKKLKISIRSIYDYFIK